MYPYSSCHLTQVTCCNKWILQHLFRSLKTKWDIKLAYHQRHNTGQKEASPELPRSGCMHPYDRNVIPKDQYDPETFCRYQEQTKLEKNQDENKISEPSATGESQDKHAKNEDLTNQPSCSGMHGHRIKISSLSQFATSSSTTVSNNQSSVPYRDRTFDGILLETLLQHSKPNMKKKTRILGGAEVITSLEARLKKEKDENEKTNFERKEEKKKFVDSSSDEEQFGLEALENNIEQELKEAERDGEYFQPQQTVQIGRWVLASQVVGITEDNEPEVKFVCLHKVMAQGTSFHWQEEVYCVSSDVIMSLPEPYINHRGDIYTFS
ncbi:hypothetical protein PR048_027430 [Dryococelus australis]|uniref:Uncharacterized protein n=1 Tax=Dryococelus australis TaxID=614101 RepID=A0ABQ9GGN9_9NEOP|nr:hypothetical protein PR048_027430 [Dryococelus australis]